MIISDSSFAINPNFLADQLDQLLPEVKRAVRERISIRDFEQFVQQLVAQIGASVISLYLEMQGTGDLGETITTEEGETFYRSDEPRQRTIRTIFGVHQFRQYVYGRNLDRKTDFYPVDVAIQMPEGKYSLWFREIIHHLCVNDSYQQVSDLIQLIFGQQIPVDSLERITNNLSKPAEQFLNQIPIPAPEEEGKILVVSADGKGVPMVRQTKPFPAFEKRSYPGNRRMATLATVYSVDEYVRAPEEIIASLFRENMEHPQKRPHPVGKVVAGFLSQCDEESVLIKGTHRATVWAAEQVERRHQTNQPLVRLMDGQISLWDASDVNFDSYETIDILDIIHVASYVWDAAKVFGSHREYQEAFARDRLLRILKGDVKGVISGMRQMAKKQQMKGERLKKINQVCNYLERNSQRMRYDTYLQQGLPIATGVIEGACRHLVMDRMCRTGMRWTTKGAQAMLHARAIHQACKTTDFHTYLANQEYQRTAQYRKLLNLPHLPPLPG